MSKVMNVTKKCKVGDAVCLRQNVVVIVIASFAAFIASPLDEVILVAVGIITVPIAIASSSTAMIVFWIVIPIISFVVTFLLAKLIFKWLARRRS